MAVFKTRECSICRSEPSVVRSILTEPLVGTHITWVCLDCYTINRKAAEALQRQNPRLVLTECAA